MMIYSFNNNELSVRSYDALHINDDKYFYDDDDNDGDEDR